MGGAITALNRPVDNITYSGRRKNTAENAENSDDQESMAVDGQPLDESDNNDGEEAGDVEGGNDDDREGDQGGDQGGNQNGNEGGNQNGNEGGDQDGNQGGNQEGNQNGNQGENQVGDQDQDMENAEAGDRSENNAVAPSAASGPLALANRNPSPSRSVVWWQAFKDIVTLSVGRTSHANIRVNPFRICKALKDKVKARARAQPKRLAPRPRGSPL